MDPEGEFYAFENGVEKTGGDMGFADVWYEGRFAFDYKMDSLFGSEHARKRKKLPPAIRRLVVDLKAE